jgi:hypothetical protein
VQSGAAKPPADCHTITVPNVGYQKQLFLIVRAFAYVSPMRTVELCFIRSWNRYIIALSAVITATAMHSDISGPRINSASRRRAEVDGA